eukprot:gene14436-biopygen10458
MYCSKGGPKTVYSQLGGILRKAFAEIPDRRLRRAAAMPAADDALPIGVDFAAGGAAPAAPAEPPVEQPSQEAPFDAAYYAALTRGTDSALRVVQIPGRGKGAVLARDVCAGEVSVGGFLTSCSQIVAVKKSRTVKTVGKLN